VPYNSIISATDAASLIPQEVSAEIIKSVAAQNPIMALARRLPDMSTSQRRIPVMSALATAYFVSGSTGLKQTTEVNWENKYVDAEELAVIVPIAESVLNDSAFDIWAEVRPSIEEAFTKAITGAVLYGTNIPASWTTNLGAAGIVAACTAASQTISIASYTDLYEAILGEKDDGTDGLYMLLEADGFGVTGNIAHASMRGKLRNCRSTDGVPIFKPSMQGPTSYDLDGTPVYFPTDGSIVAGSSLLISGDWKQLVYAVRQDITFKVLDQAIIQDASGAIVYNLAQQDMVALRAVMRLGFAMPNPINRMNETAATRLPFATLTA
jgi:HK97 family phage major capsid protein